MSGVKRSKSGLVFDRLLMMLMTSPPAATPPAGRWKRIGRCPQCPLVCSSCSSRATGPWRTPPPSASAAVRDARGCCQSVQQELEDCPPHRWRCCSFASCSSSSSSTHPALCLHLQMKISDEGTLQNLTGRNISDYLVKTYAKIIGKR